MKKTRNVTTRSRKQAHARKARFDAAKAKGMQAIREGDYKLLKAAIREESEIVKEDALVLTARDRLLKKRKNLKGTKR